MVYSTFDFDELDETERSLSCSMVVEQSRPCSPDGPTFACETLASPTLEAPSEAVVQTLEEASESVDADSENHVSLRRKKTMSRARAWFEIRRFFDAEPQQFYGSKDSNEWKTYYAKELILKATCERLQQDGYVVVDAQLAPDYFQRLVGQLRLDAPEQVAALEGHVQSHASMLRDRESNEDNSSQASSLLPAVAANEVASEHSRALCDSCLLSLAIDRRNCSELRPHTKQQFLRLFRTYIHEVAANSMSEDRGYVRDADKIHVQFAFGNMPSPKAALAGPPRQLSVEGLTL